MASSCRRQVVVEAPVDELWDLIGDVNRHPEWWPRVEQVECEALESGCTYRQVTKTPRKTIETTISIEALDDCRELRVRCLDTGTWAAFLLAPMQGSTFLDMELGIEPHGPEKLIARVFVRRWLDQSVEGLRNAASASSSVR